MVELSRRPCDMKRGGREEGMGGECLGDEEMGSGGRTNVLCGVWRVANNLEIAACPHLTGLASASDLRSIGSTRPIEEPQTCRCRPRNGDYNLGEIGKGGWRGARGRAAVRRASGRDATRRDARGGVRVDSSRKNAAAVSRASRGGWGFREGDLRCWSRRAAHVLPTTRRM